MSNLGVYPPNTTTTVGSLRAMVGDVNAVIDHGNGTADYQFFADVELAAIVAQTTSLNRQMMYAYLKMYAILSASAASITTDDLRADTTFRATQFKNLATLYGGLADDADALSGSADMFLLAGGKTGAQINWIERQDERLDPYVGVSF